LSKKVKQKIMNGNNNEFQTVSGKEEKVIALLKRLPMKRTKREPGKINCQRATIVLKENQRM